MARDKERTKKKILKAVNRLLARKGFDSVGINAVAKEAGVDKVLIYRYFGGMAQLLQSFGETSEFWPTFDELVGTDKEALKRRPFEERVTQVTRNFAQALKRRPLTQEILAWELVERSRLNAVLVKVRKELARKLFKEFGLAPARSETDILAVITLLAAGINYLVLRARIDKDFNGMDIRSQKGWRRIERAVETVCTRCLKVVS